MKLRLIIEYFNPVTFIGIIDRLRGALEFVIPLVGNEKEIQVVDGWRKAVCYLKSYYNLSFNEIITHHTHVFVLEIVAVVQV